MNHKLLSRRNSFLAAILSLVSLLSLTGAGSSPAQRNFAAMRVRIAGRYLLTLLALLSLLTLTGSAVGFPSRTVRDAQAAPGQGEQTFYVDWNITASGDSTGESAGFQTTIHRRIAIQGSAVVHNKPSGLAETLPFLLTVTDDTDELETSYCERTRTRTSITDPGRYMGGPDKFWNYASYFWPRQRGDGSWYMADPFALPFYANAQLGRVFTYRIDQVRGGCGEGYSDTFTYENIGYATAFGVFPYGLFEGDATGTIFSRDETYVVNSGQQPLTVNFHATIRLACGAAAASTAAPSQQVCGCAALPKTQPIDASNPIITNLDVSLDYVYDSEIDPDAGTYLVAGVTCEGVPVQNAEIEVTTKPFEGSGFHLHGGPRPRGYLNGTKITDAGPSIKLRTGSYGNVQIYFEPGRDLTNETRGIAGTYEIKVRDTRFRHEVKLDVWALVKGLVRLNPSSDLTGNFDSTREHLSTLYGTQSTLNAVVAMAADFKQRQIDHNLDLAFYGLPTWPIVKPYVWGISLVRGGLFDLSWHGWWSIPFDQHRRGTDVLWLTDPLEEVSVPPGVSQESATAVLVSEFLDSGDKYGRWFNDAGSHWNVKISQSQAAAQIDRPQALMSDLRVRAFLTNPWLRSTAAASQVVTFTLGLDNVTAEDTANNVVLTATLPSGLIFLRANPPATRMNGSNRPVWDVGTVNGPGLIPPTLLRTFDIGAQIGTTVTAGTVLTITAEASTTSPETNLANNRADSFGLLVQPLGDDLALSSNLDATPMVVGRPVSFTVMIANRGNAAASVSNLNLWLPVSVTLASAIPAPTTTGPGTANWNLGGLDVDASTLVTLTVNLDPRLLWQAPPNPEVSAGGLLTWTLNASPSDFDTSNNTLTVVKPVKLEGSDLTVALGVLGAPAPGTLAVGQDITYTILYGNFGNQIAPTTTVTLSLWSGLSLVSAQPAPSRMVTSTTFAGGVLGWDLGALEVGESGNIQVRVHVASVPPEGSLVLATIDNPSWDINPLDNVSWLIRSQFVQYSHRVFLPVVQR